MPRLARITDAQRAALARLARGPLSPTSIGTGWGQSGTRTAPRVEIRLATGDALTARGLAELRDGGLRITAAGRASIEAGQ